MDYENLVTPNSFKVSKNKQFQCALTTGFFKGMSIYLFNRLLNFERLTRILKAKNF